MKCEICNHANVENTLYCEKCGANLYKSKLRIIHESGLNKTHYLFSQNYRVGRGMDNDIVIPDASVSRYHAELRYQRGGFEIRDKDSKNGSLLNNLRFRRSPLQNHDCIQLGNVILHYYNDSQLLRAASHFDTIEFVQKEYFKLAENRQTNVTTTDALNAMLDLTLSLLHADQAAILKCDPAAGLKLEIGKNVTNDILVTERNLLDQVAKSKKMHIGYLKPVKKRTTRVTNEDPSWDHIIFPLLASKGGEEPDEDLGRNGLLGLCYLGHRKKVNPISTRKRELLTALMQHMALAIENELLYDESHENKRIRDEISSAKIIQERLLTTSSPKIKELEIVSLIEPCETISGDYFDIVRISDDLIALAIGDICGKGVPAALLSSTAQAAIRSQLEYSASPEQIVQKLNRLLIQSTTNSIFLTLFFGILNLKTNKFRYINAGHMPPVFISANGKFRELAGTTPPLGILECQLQAERSMTFGPDDILLMYTDGLIESQNKRKQIYGRRRFKQLLEDTLQDPGKRTVRDLVKTIKSDLVKFVNGTKRADDLTLLAVRRK